MKYPECLTDNNAHACPSLGWWQWWILGKNVFQSFSLCLSFVLLCDCALADEPGEESDQALTVRTDKMRVSLEASAMYSLAKTMLEDKTITNVSGVKDLLHTAADSGYSQADTLLLHVYEGKFKGLPAEREKALALASKIALREEGEDHRRDLTRMKEKAKAMFHLAHYKEVGWGCEPAPAEAFKWMEQSSFLGNRLARVALARYYMQGVGCQRDYIKALTLLKAQMGYDPTVPNLYFYLGFMCERGLGLSKPQHQWAVQYYTRGAELGDAHAMNNLASMYERGVAVSEDNSQALRLYRTAAKLGNKEASKNLQRLGYLIDQESKKDESPSWQLLANRGLLRLSSSLPFASPLTDYLRARNREMEAKLNNATP